MTLEFGCGELGGRDPRRALLLAAVLGLIASVLTAFYTHAGVDPVNVTVTNSRADAVGAALGMGTVYRGETVAFTNCLALGAGGTTQNLAGVTVTMAVGPNVTNAVVYTGAVVNAAGGLYSVSGVAVPAAYSFSTWLRLADGTNTFIYPSRLQSAEPSPF